MSQAPSAIERAVLELQDRVRILETLYSYCRHADQLDAEGMVAHFTPDCVVVFHDDGPTLRGRDELGERLKARLGVTISGSHHVSNEELLFQEPDTVVGHAYMYSWQRFKGHPATPDVHRWGRYELRFVRADGAWLISRMRLLSAGELGSHRIAEHIGKPWPPDFSP